MGRCIGGEVPQTTVELADLVLEQAKVAFVPGEAFGTPGYARFSFALGDDARWVPSGSVLTPSVAIEGMSIAGS